MSRTTGALIFMLVCEVFIAAGMVASFPSKTAELTGAQAMMILGTFGAFIATCLAFPG